MSVGTFLIWTIGLDRLFAIKFATSYPKWSLKPYLLLMVLPAVAYSAALTAVGFVSSSPKELILLCMPPTAFRGIASDVWMMNGVVINILVMITYGWVFVLVRKQ
uniref:G-protein coupled receptors family 1 profile domain-containing protein n=1 Tax=Plectus sambesii TaxID=2011161 RepID=A0A914WV22_9BILA